MMISGIPCNCFVDEEVSTGGYTSIVTTIVAAVILIYIAIVRKAIRSRYFKCDVSLHGKTIIITGSNTGIGKETAKDFAKRGAKVIMACRNLDKANKAAKDIRKQDPKANIVVMKLDLASFESIRNFCKEVLAKECRIDVLVNNAGLCCSKSKTKDGHDMIFGTNHLGPFLLTHLLLDRIKKSAPARIITVSSIAHWLSFGMNWDDLNFDEFSTYPVLRAFFQSKLANVLFSSELARRLEGSEVTTYSLDPGLVNTNFHHNLEKCVGPSYGKWFKILYGWLSKTAEQGAQTTIYCAVDEQLENETGLYYANCVEKTPSKAARDMDDAKTLWKVSLKMVGIENDTTVKKK